MAYQPSSFVNLTTTDRCLVIKFKTGKVTVGLHGTDWIASSGTDLSVSYAGDAFQGVQISHGLPDPLLGHVPAKRKCNIRNPNKLCLREGTEVCPAVLAMCKEYATVHFKTAN